MCVTNSSYVVVCEKCSLKLCIYLRHTHTHNAHTQNIHSTAQRAMRSGDGGTVAALTVSHHKSLLLMREQSRQLEEVVRSEGERKRRVTQHIHQVRGREGGREGGCVGVLKLYSVYNNVCINLTVCSSGVCGCVETVFCI